MKHIEKILQYTSILIGIFAFYFFINMGYKKYGYEGTVIFLLSLISYFAIIRGLNTKNIID